MPQSLQGGSNALPRLRGVLLCRRCDACGTRIGLESETKDRIIMKCPHCQKEYVFTERR